MSNPNPGSDHRFWPAWQRKACTVVTDEYPCFFLPNLIKAVKDRLPVPLELVDGNGVVPMRLPERTFTVAHSYRRWMQKNILDCLAEIPACDCLSNADLPTLKTLPADITKTWKAADLEKLLSESGLADIPIDHSVAPSPVVRGGSVAAAEQLDRFLADRLNDYGDERNHPDEHATTGLSPQPAFWAHRGA